METVIITCDMNVDELKIKALLEGLEAENIEEFMREGKADDYRNYGKAYVSAVRNKISEVISKHNLLVKALVCDLETIEKEIENLKSQMKENKQKERSKE